MIVEIEDDIEADVRAALSADLAPEPISDPTPTPEPEPNPVPEPATEGPARSADGKFAKAPEMAQSIPQPAEAEQPIRPPAAWSAQAKATFATLPPHIQAEVVKRERDMDKGLQERAQNLKKYEPLEELFASRRERWATQGTNETTVIGQLLAAQDWLDRDPAEALSYLAQSYGLSPAQFLGQQPAQAPQNSGQDREIQALNARLAAFEQAQQQREQDELTAQVSAFADDPKNLYFENVRGHMAQLIQSGAAPTIQDAYDQACWGSPEIRNLLLAEQAKAEQAKLTQAVRANVANANGAAGSVSGSGAGVAQVPQTGNSIEDDVRAAFQSIRGRA